jgi:hypothetical protein
MLLSFSLGRVRAVVRGLCERSQPFRGHSTGESKRVDEDSIGALAPLELYSSVTRSALGWNSEEDPARSERGSERGRICTNGAARIRRVVLPVIISLTRRMG